MTITETKLKAVKDKVLANQLADALLDCMRILASDWSNTRARLLLARIYFKLELYNFAAREVALLVDEFPDSLSLTSLLQKLDPSSQFVKAGGPSGLTVSSTNEQVLAEADFEVEILGDLDE